MRTKKCMLDYEYAAQNHQLVVQPLRVWFGRSSSPRLVQSNFVNGFSFSIVVFIWTQDLKKKKFQQKSIQFGYKF